MSAKQLMPNQCLPLHLIYGPSDCCLCSAKSQLQLLKNRLRSLIQYHRNSAGKFLRGRAKAMEQGDNERKRRYESLWAMHEAEVQRLEDLLKV